MSGLNLNALSENASRLGMRIQESFSEHTRDLAIGGSSTIFDTPDEKAKNIRKQLDSSSDREKLDAMKRLIALISKGRNVSEYFAQVVKNVASSNLEIRKLVYIYLLRYSSFEPDLALLSINTFQRDLTDPSPLIRAMALRVLSGIKVPMIGSIVVLAIKKCAADTSPYVRKAAALAIPKCYDLDDSHLASLIPIIASLLRDRSPLSIGAASLAFQVVCPTRLDILHPQYRRLCRILVDVDEWGQVELLELLIRYARTMLPRPIIVEEDIEEVDKDLQLLLKGSEPLFQSRNPAVVLAVTRLFYYVAPPSHLPKILHPLLRLPHISPAVERVVLSYILLISPSHPTLFAPYYMRFLVRTDDISQVKRDKIALLLNIITTDNLQPILREFIDYSDDVDDVIVATSIRALGRCARLHPECTQQCLSALMTMIKSGQDIVVSNAVLVLKSLVQTQLHAGTMPLTSSMQPPLAIIAHLARRIDDIRHSQARACVLWLVGQYSEVQSKGMSDSLDGVVEWAPDVLRKVAKTFNQETIEVKLQISTLAAKLLVLSPAAQPLHLLSRYIFSLARYDTNYDVRDRTRMLVSLLAGLAPTLNDNSNEQTEERGGVILRREQVKRVLFEGKAGLIENDDVFDDDHAMLGSLGVITRKEMRGDRYLPFWLEKGIESTLRDTEEDIPVVSFTAMSSAQARSLGPSHRGSPVVLTPTEGTSPVGPGMRGGEGKGPWADLDKFYADEHDDSSEGESQESDDSIQVNNGAVTVREQDEDQDEDEEDEEDEESNEEPNEESEEEYRGDDPQYRS